VRPMPLQNDAGKSARDERREAEVEKKPTVTTPIATPTAKPELRTSRAVPTQREVRTVEQPAVATKPAARPVTTNPVRDEKKVEVEIVRKTTTPTPIVAPTAKPEVRPARVLPTQRELRPAQKPAVATKPTPQPVAASPIRNEKKLETAGEKKNPATPLTVEPGSRNEARPVTRPETKPVFTVGTARPNPVIAQTTPSPERPAANRQNSPREKSQATERSEANKTKAEVKSKGPAKKGEEQATRVDTNRPSR